jgi:energy-coupling factor transporter ATP-binding protein EcfA2
MKGEHDQDASSAARPGEEGAAGPETPRLRLRSLKVHAFRDVRPGTELRFGDGFHLILGKNASGKSTLLELLAAVSVLDFRRPFFAETPFHVEASFDVGKISFHMELRRTFEPQRVKTVGDQYLDLPPRDEAEMTIRLEHPGVPLCRWVRARTGEDLRVFTKDPVTEEDQGTSRMLLGRADPLRLPVATVLSFGAILQIDGASWMRPEAWPVFLSISEHPGTGAPFDEALGTLQAMVGGGLTIVRGEGYRSPTPWLPPPLDFDAKGEPVTVDLSNHPLLKAAIGQLGYDDAKAYFGPGAPGNSTFRYSSPSFQLFRGGKPVRRHDQLSFGQQRLFSFAWYLACNPDVAIADELVNGLHSDWIDWCVETLRDRQCFLTSQNPILVDTVPFGSVEQIKRGIILCESVHDAERDAVELRWRQLDDRESELIARALGQSRLDLLSDLLHALDLW